MHECSFCALTFALVHNIHASRHACSSSYTRQQNERLVRAHVQFPMMLTWKMLRAFLKTYRAMQLLHACVVKFKVSSTVRMHVCILLKCVQGFLTCNEKYALLLCIHHQNPFG